MKYENFEEAGIAVGTCLETLNGKLIGFRRGTIVVVTDCAATALIARPENEPDHGGNVLHISDLGNGYRVFNPSPLEVAEAWVDKVRGVS